MNNPKRKLAAIVFTDIVGFTELSAKNEPAALELLNTQRKLFKPIVHEHGGDWLKEIGDGLLLTFKTNREAVFCSIAMQEAAKAVKELQLRIGIHQGEVVFQGEDVVGDAVNITSISLSKLFLNLPALLFSHTELQSLKMLGLQLLPDYKV